MLGSTRQTRHAATVASTPISDAPLRWHVRRFHSRHYTKPHCGATSGSILCLLSIPTIPRRSELVAELAPRYERRPRHRVPPRPRHSVGISAAAELTTHRLYGVRP